MRPLADQPPEGKVLLLQRALLSLSFVFVSICSAAGSKQAGWVEASTPHFVLYCEGSESPVLQEQIQKTLNRLESARSFFLGSGFAEAVPQSSVRVVVFAGEASYSAYRTTPGAFAFYRRVRDNDYIVMQQLTGGPERAAVHEYVHSVFYGLAPKLPVWLAEGLAEVYSSTRMDMKDLAFGAAIPEHLRSLKTAGPLNVEALFAARQTSSSYLQPGERWNFYATSWAAARMLVFDAHYASHFSRFLHMAGSGVSTEEALQATYGESASAFEANLASYLQQGQWSAFPEHVEMARMAVEIKPDTSVTELDAIFADLVQPGSAGEAQIQARLEQAAARDRLDPVPDEALGYLALRSRHTVEARTYLQAAADKGDRKPDALLRLAELDVAAGAPVEDLMPLLRQAVDAEAGNDNAHFRLGWLAAKTGHYALAVSMLSEVRTISPEQRFALLYTLAYCCLKTEDGERGRTFGLDARAEAHTPEQQQQVETLLRYAESRRTSSQTQFAKMASNAPTS